jgi:hypothetical protein
MFDWAMQKEGSSADDSSMETASARPQTAYVCRFCEQPIAPRTGVLAAPRLAPEAQPSAPPLQLFGTPERFHVLCVPASYRLDERF